MVEWMNSWIQGIIFAVIITTLIEMIIPNSNIKKYIRTVIGVFIVFTIISPILTKVTGKTISLNSIMTSSDSDKYKMNSIDNYIIDTNSYIEQDYINNVKEDIVEKVNKKGYMVHDLEIKIETENEENYGQLLEMSFKISKYNNFYKNDSSQEEISIEPVEIEITEKEEEVPDEAEDYESLKEYLESIYGINKENIIIKG